MSVPSLAYLSVTLGDVCVGFMVTCKSVTSVTFFFGCVGQILVTRVECLSITSVACLSVGSVTFSSVTLVGFFGGYIGCVFVGYVVHDISILFLLDDTQHVCVFPVGLEPNT